MQPLDPLGNYAPAEVIDALSGRTGSRVMSYRFDRLSSAGDYLGALGNVLAGNVDNNRLAPV